MAVGGRQYLLTFDETNGHKQTNSNTGTSRALKRQLKAPIPVPVAQPPPPTPAPTPASAPYPTPTAYSPQPTSLYGAIQASHQSAQWGFYGDSGKFVPFKPAQSKVECLNDIPFTPQQSDQGRERALDVH